MAIIHELANMAKNMGSAFELDAKCMSIELYKDILALLPGECGVICGYGKNKTPQVLLFISRDTGGNSLRFVGFFKIAANRKTERDVSVRVLLDRTEFSVLLGGYRTHLPAWYVLRRILEIH